MFSSLLKQFIQYNFRGLTLSTHTSNLMEKRICQKVNRFPFHIFCEEVHLFSKVSGQHVPNSPFSLWKHTKPLLALGFSSELPFLQQEHCRSCPLCGYVEVALPSWRNSGICELWETSAISILSREKYQGIVLLWKGTFLGPHRKNSPQLPSCSVHTFL